MIVVGLMIERGDANGEIQKMLDNTPNTPGTATHNQTTIPFDPSKILPKATKKFYTYAGSLTTPPCTEGVNWYIYSSPISMSVTQLDALRGFYEGNNRNLQPLNGKQPVTNKK
jgi:carbonic anhydrase